MKLPSPEILGHPGRPGHWAAEDPLEALSSQRGQQSGRGASRRVALALACGPCCWLSQAVTGPGEGWQGPRQQ